MGTSGPVKNLGGELPRLQQMGHGILTVPLGLLRTPLGIPCHPRRRIVTARLRPGQL